MRVIICEDDEKQRAYIYTKLTRYAWMHCPSTEFVLTASKPEQVLSYLEYNTADCYFLDIELESNQTGMDLANEIRKRDPLATIIFVTTYADMLQLTFTYKLAALDFIVKGNNDKFSKQLVESLEAAYQKYEKLGNIDKLGYFQVKIGELIKNVPFNDIYYFETSHQVHKVYLHEKNGYYEFYGTLKDLENINPRFYRCHKSYIVNLQNIKEINRKERKITMINDIECPLSFRASYGIQEKFDICWGV